MKIKLLFIGLLFLSYFKIESINLKISNEFKDGSADLLIRGLILSQPLRLNIPAGTTKEQELEIDLARPLDKKSLLLDGTVGSKSLNKYIDVPKDFKEKEYKQIDIKIYPEAVTEIVPKVNSSFS